MDNSSKIKYCVPLAFLYKMEFLNNHYGAQAKMTTGVNKILNSMVKAELNMLYTESPFVTPTGSDFGLFCREHAYHTYFLRRLGGYPVEIKIGHYLVIVPNGHCTSTLNSGADHVWCASGNLRPIDLSMTFHLAEGFPDIEHPVLGTGQNGPYMISYIFDEFAFRKYHDDLPDICCLCYLETETFPANDELLLKNPFTFLKPPFVPGRSWADVHGHDIFAKITLHLHNVALGNIKPLYEQISAREAITFIKSHYPKALSTLRKEIAKNAQSINRT